MNKENAFPPERTETTGESCPDIKDTLSESDAMSNEALLMSIDRKLADTDRLLATVKYVAPMLNMSEQSLRRAVRKGLVPALIVRGKIGFDLDVIEAWLECGGSPWCDRKRNEHD